MVMRRIIISIFLIPAFICAGVSLAYPYVYRSATIEFSDFKKFTGNLYVDNKLSHQESETLIGFVQQASYRIEKKFGNYTASPVIIVVANDERAKQYGLHNSPAVAYITPWEQYVIIGPNAQNIDVMAQSIGRINALFAQVQQLCPRL